MLLAFWSPDLTDPYQRRLVAVDEAERAEA